MKRRTRSAAVSSAAPPAHAPDQPGHNLEIDTRGPEETRVIGQAIGRLAAGGQVIALTGPLGAGKTQLVKGIAAGLNVVEEPVVSPTFVLVREYVGRLRLYHLDAYRLSGSQELLALGFEEMCADAGAVVAIEWADRVADCIAPEALRIDIEHGEPDAAPSRRHIRLTGSAPLIEMLMRTISSG